MMEPFAALPGVRETFEEASQVLGQDLWHLAAEGPAEEMGRTVNTQPLMLVAGIALYRAWRMLGGAAPDFVAGHSLGEYTGWQCADALQFREVVSFVRIRAQAMQDAVPEGTGGIAAILGLEDEAIRAVCRDAAQREVLEPANYNAPGQVVIAGHRSAVERGMALAKERGAKRVVMLPMSAPSHCSLMQAAADRLQSRIAGLDVRPPRIALITNVDVKVPQDAQAVRDSMVRQLCSPVRWVETVQRMAAEGVTRIIECGPGGVLTGLNKRGAQLEAIALRDAEQLSQLAASTGVAGDRA
jgi:[acyl-carrier-protein] S-malonyltransferase